MSEQMSPPFRGGRGPPRIPHWRGIANGVPNKKKLLAWNLHTKKIIIFLLDIQEWLGIMSI